MDNKKLFQEISVYREALAKIGGMVEFMEDEDHAELIKSEVYTALNRGKDIRSDEFKNVD